MIVKCNNGKATSPADSICNEYIKTSKHLQLPAFVKLFNFILDTGFFPKLWSEGYILPIYKQKGESSTPENYRPITILSCLGKLFTAVLNERLTSFSDKFKILSENQAGFRKNHSTLDHTFTLKFFNDLVPRFELFHKLINAGIDGKILRIIKICTQISNLVYNLMDNVQRISLVPLASDKEKI